MTDAESLVRDVLVHIGEDPEREGLRDTPKRVVRAWKELYAGYAHDPAAILATVFEEGKCDEMVLLKDIPFMSTCEHHMEKILGVVHIGYIPNGRVVGLSKLARLVDCFALRLQIQEQLTTQIAGAIQKHLEPKGVAVVIEAAHQCMSCRGIKKLGATMVTSSLLGVMRDHAPARAEFMALIK